MKLASGESSNAFPTGNQGLLVFTIHHPNACPNNTKDLDFEPLEIAENTAKGHFQRWIEEQGSVEIHVSQNCDE